MEDLDQRIAAVLSGVVKAGTSKRESRTVVTSPAWRATTFKFDESRHEHLPPFAETCERFVKAWHLNVRRRKPWLVVAGQCGSGKTHMGKRISWACKRMALDSWTIGSWPGNRLPEVAFLDWPRACTWPDHEFREWLDEHDASTLLVVDDLGADTDKYKNDMNLVRLKWILDDCDHKFLYATTNVPRPHWADKFDQRIASRLREAKYVDLFAVPDYRIKT